MCLGLNEVAEILNTADCYPRWENVNNIHVHVKSRLLGLLLLSAIQEAATLIRSLLTEFDCIFDQQKYFIQPSVIAVIYLILRTDQYTHTWASF